VCKRGGSRRAAFFLLIQYHKQNSEYINIYVYIYIQVLCISYMSRMWNNCWSRGIAFLRVNSNGEYNAEYSNICTFHACRI